MVNLLVRNFARAGKPSPRCGSRRWYNPSKTRSADDKYGAWFMKFIVNLDRDETGMIVAECPAIPGCVSQGKTETEALANIREAIEACLEARAASGMPLTVATREVEVAV